MATFFGSNANHADGGTAVTSGSNPGAPITITPPASMVAGQLVVVDVIVRTGSGVDSTIPVDGGQSWTSETRSGAGALTVRRHWCIFDGTWDADPQFTPGDWVGAPVTIVMTVWSPTSGYAFESDNANSSVGGNFDGSGYYTVNPPNTTTDGAISVSMHAGSEDTNFALSTANGWTAAVNGLDNSSGTGLCVGVYYKILATAGDPGDFTVYSATANGNSARSNTMAWREVPSATLKLKFLVQSTAVGSTVAGVVFQPPATGDITGDKIGEFTGVVVTAGAGADSGKGVVLVPVSEFGGGALAVDDPVVCLVRDADETTGIEAAIIIEE